MKQTNGFELGGLSFKNKAAVGRHAREILYKYSVGGILEELDRSFVLDLVDLHPRREEKIADGVNEVRIMAPMLNCRCFQLVRIGGSLTDFSYKKCLEKATNKREVKAAARFLVSDQTIAFRARNENPSLDYHVDHTPPQTFDVLLADFLRSEGKHIKDVAVVNVGDCQIGKLFVDVKLGEQWKEYHRKHAKLRLITAEENLKLAKMKGNYELIEDPTGIDEEKTVDSLEDDPPW